MPRWLPEDPLQEGKTGKKQGRSMVLKLSGNCEILPEHCRMEHIYSAGGGRLRNPGREGREQERSARPG
jgi:hypothetical protein